MTADDRTERITLSGNLDVYSKSHVESLLPDPERCERLIIDCSRVAIFESAVLTVLMRYRRRFEEAGRDPFDIVVIVTPSVRRIFDITGLSRALTIITATQSDDDALANAKDADS